MLILPNVEILHPINKNITFSNVKIRLFIPFSWLPGDFAKEISLQYFNKNEYVKI